MNIQPLVEIATTGLRFCFEVTLDDRQVMRMMSTVHEPRKLPVILSPEEVKRLLDATTNLKYQAALLFEIIAAKGEFSKRKNCIMTPNRDETTTILLEWLSSCFALACVDPEY